MASGFPGRSTNATGSPCATNDHRLLWGWGWPAALPGTGGGGKRPGQAPDRASGSDSSRLPEASLELHRWLRNMPHSTPVVILITKVDAPVACSTAEVCWALRLSELRHFELYTQRCCATTGAGLGTTAQLLGSLLGRPIQG